MLTVTYTNDKGWETVEQIFQVVGKESIEITETARWDVINENDEIISFTGKNIVYQGDIPTSGTVQKIAVTAAGNVLLMTVEGVIPIGLVAGELFDPDASAEDRSIAAVAVLFSGDDTFKGADNSSYVEEFMGLGGRDLLDGGEGWDRAWYYDDERLGGGAGIVANLKTRKIVDGFGDTDSVKSIEEVVGTRFNDKFLGSSGDENFMGGAGRDHYDGRGGRDGVMFWAMDSWGAADRINVDLSRKSNQVKNDGFGNKETLVSIEDLVGSGGRDRFVGSAGDNRFFGIGDNDVFDGKGGSDTLFGEFGNDNLTGGKGADAFGFTWALDAQNNVDLIKDFDPREDVILLDPDIFSAIGNGGSKLKKSDFIQGAEPIKSSHHIIYDKKSGKLFYDEDGNGSAPQILFAKFANKAVIKANDFFVGDFFVFD